MTSEPMRNTAGQPATDTGYDGPKKITGRERHLAIDTLGLLLVVVVTSAVLDDAAAAREVLGQLHSATFLRLAVEWADTKCHNHKLQHWVDSDTRRAWRLEAKNHPERVNGFELLPKR